MITLQTAENALKDVYLNIIADNLNCNTNPLLTKIKQTSADIYGAKILKIPSWQQNYEDCPRFEQELSNIYASIEITDKAIRCSQNSAGAFVNLLNDAIEHMLNDTKIETTRALFVKSNYLKFIGLDDLFNKNQKTLYGLDKKKYKELQAVCLEEEKITPYRLMEIIDNYNDEIDIIVCGKKIMRDYKQYLLDHNQELKTISLGGGFNGLDFNGVPMVAEKFINDNEIYLLNTRDFEFKQLCDWQWLENESGKVIVQVSGKPLYKATLVKYGNLICDNPSKQIKITVKPNEKAEIWK